jgi:predicted HAD superfamily phosphohydrolase YqeG
MSIIAIDFDGTLVAGDTALAGAKYAINMLREHGHKIVIHSVNRTKWIEQVLRDADIRYDKIWDGKGKPAADLYVDDKGFHFKGDWFQAWTEILERLV